MRKGYIKYNNFAKEKENFDQQKAYNFIDSEFDFYCPINIKKKCEYWTNYNGIYQPNIVFDQFDEDGDDFSVYQWKNKA